MLEQGGCSNECWAVSKLAPAFVEHLSQAIFVSEQICCSCGAAQVQHGTCSTSSASNPHHALHPARRL